MLKDVGERLVRGLLFSEEAPLDGAVVKNSAFAQEFTKRGPFDRQGRSLRDLNLESRLPQYPLSYLIYTNSFNALPDLVKQFAYDRFRTILNGTDTTGHFEHLTLANRKAILEILRDTKPDFATRAAEH